MVSGSRFPEGFDAADSEGCLFYRLKDNAHPNTVKGLDIALCRQGRDGPADRIARTGIDLCQDIFRRQKRLKAVGGIFYFPFQIPVICSNFAFGIGTHFPFSCINFSVWPKLNQGY